MLIGAALPLFIEGLVKSESTGFYMSSGLLTPPRAGATATTRAEIPYWQPLLQLFGGMFLPILFALLFYLNLLAWSAARINHVLIFELDVGLARRYCAPCEPVDVLDTDLFHSKGSHATRHSPINRGATTPGFFALGAR